MAREIINIGNTPDDGTGDPLRTAGVKINENFEELYNTNPRLSDATVTAPLGGNPYDAQNPLHLNYNGTDFKLEGDNLRTVQRIDEDAEMTIKSLILKQGLTLDDLLGYIKSEDLTGYDYITEGLGIEVDDDGSWKMVVDQLTVRERAKFFELVFRELKVFSAILMNEGLKVDSVEQVATADWSWSDTTNVFAPGASDGNGLPYAFSDQYKMYAEKNQRVELASHDLVRRQAFSGTDYGLTQGLITDVEQGAVDVTDNSTARYARISIAEGAAPRPGQTFARLGNTTDPSRQGGIYMVGSGESAPYELMYNGVNSFDKFGTEETIKSFQGNTKGRTFSQFPELNGSQGDYYANVTQGGFFDGTLRSRNAIIGDDTSYMRFDPDLGQLVIAGSLLQRTPSSSAQPIPLRAGDYDSGKTYYKGDVVKVGSAQPTQYILTGAATSQGVDPSGSSDWQIFVESGEQGPVGPVGPSGDDGTSVSIKGTLDNESQLPSSGNTQGDGYIISGDLYVWDGANWNNVGPFRGPQGPGSPFRGNYDSSTTYYGFDQRADVVYYNGTYWIVQADTGANGSSSLGTPDNNNSNWTQFGGVYDNIATGVVLARDATVTHTLILGTNDPNNPDAGTNGIIRSANFDDTAGQLAGFRLQAQNGKVQALSGELGNLQVRGMLSVAGSQIKIGKGIYDSPDLGPQDGIITATGGLLLSDQGIDIDAKSGTAGEIEWHDTASEDDLNSNSNLVGELGVSVTSSLSSFSMRAQSTPSRDSEIVLTATRVRAEANVELMGNLLLSEYIFYIYSTNPARITGMGNNTTLVIQKTASATTHIEYIEPTDRKLLLVYNDTGGSLYFDNYQNTLNGNIRVVKNLSNQEIAQNNFALFYCRNGKYSIHSDFGAGH